MANHVESFWGNAILDSGWTILPNILSRNIKKLGIEYGEFVLICNILSHKHDTRDPFPSQELLSEYQEVSVRQIQKLVKSLREKGFMKTGRRRNKVTGNWISSVYSFEPLLQKLNVIAAELYEIKTEDDIEIVWDDDNLPHEHEVRVATRTRSSEPHEHEVRVDENVDKSSRSKGLKTENPDEHQVRTNNKIENNNENITTTNIEVHSVVVDELHNQFKQMNIVTTKASIKLLLTAAKGDIEWVKRLMKYARTNSLGFGWIKTQVENKEDINDTTVSVSEQSTKPDKYAIFYQLYQNGNSSPKSLI